VDKPDRDSVQEVQLLAPASLGRDETSLFEQSQVLHNAETRHWQSPLKRAERLAVFLEHQAAFDVSDPRGL